MVPEKSREPHLTHIPATRDDDRWAAALAQPPERAPTLADDGSASLRPADRAYEGIKRAILAGALKSGEHLGVEQLAQMTRTSRTPVRDALSRLVADGLATQESRHRFVADFSYDEVIVVMDLRAKIEGYAAGLAAQRITPAEIDALCRIIDDIDALTTLTPERAAELFGERNAAFHAAVVQATRSRQLQALSAKVAMVPLVIIKLLVLDQGINIAGSNNQHREIVEALARRNSQWAEHAMTAHVLSTKPEPRRQGSELLAARPPRRAAGA